MSGHGLDLHLGDSLQLQFLQDDGHRVRPSVRFIGQMPQASLIVTAPTQDGKLMVVREGQVFVVRCFTRDVASAFTCRVLRVCSLPYPYLHLSYPERREEVLVRSSRRVSVLMSATVVRQREGGTWSIPMAAIVSDMSTTGAMLETSEPLGKVETKLKISFQLPIDGMGEQALSVEGVVRSVYEEGGEGDRNRYGIEFQSVPSPAQLVLRAFIYEQLLGGDH
jgi:c-di-GMP-binding flagellar brake protein YcgR